ncbi:MAG: PilC/PilY family type IV pilus protein [Methylobacter sp.]
MTAVITTTSTRTAIAKQAAKDLVTSLSPASGGNATVRMGLSRYNGSDGGLLLSELKDLDSTQSTTLKNSIDNIPASGVTPLATTLSDIGKYFATGETGNLKLHPNATTPTSASVDTIFSKADGTTSHSIKNGTCGSSTCTNTLAAPILGYCQKSFVILVSDGLPNGDREVSPSLRDYTGDCATKNLCDSTPNSTTLAGTSTPLTSTGTLCGSGSPVQWYNKACKNGTKAGRIYETGGSDYVDDVAQALYEMDLRPSLDSTLKANTHTKNNLVTYAIGLADPTLQAQSVLSDAATVGGGKFYFAGDSQALAAALDDTISEISSKVGSSSSVAANSSKLENGSVIYQAKFDSANWTGSFTAFPLGASEDTNGNGVLDPGEDTNNNGKLDAGSIGAKIWNSAEKIPAYASRNIYTYNATSSLGVAFTCANLSTSQKSTLGIVDCSSSTDQGVWRLNYLRGDWSHEQLNPNRLDTDTIRTGTNLIFRNRTYLDKITGTTNSPDPWVLGDIVNSDPVFVSAEDFGYDKLPGSEGSSYKAFVINNKERRKMVYVGANDGMFHGFDANATGTDAGKEILAYVPNAVYNQLRSLSDPGYDHVYSVDGSPRAGDAYFDSAWHTVLLSSTGAGGKAVFALNITDPSNFIGSNVLWEISDAYSPTATDQSTDTTTTRGFGNNMGYSIPQPSIARMQDGSWAAIVANGYGSINNLAVLYIIDIKTGHLIKAIDTKTGNSTTPNGLSTPIAVDTNNDKMVDSIYAGDLLGNMWKFDVNSNNSANWTIAYGTSSAPAPLFVACTDSSNCNTTRQPITGKPQVGNVNSSQTTNGSTSGFMVYFGTGKYFEDVDNIVTNAQTQSFYGIWDNNATVNKSDLQSQSIIAEVISGGFNLRATTDNTVDYSTKKGWYMNLLQPSATTSIGERVVSAPLLRNGRIIFETLIPIPPAGTDVCGAAASGTSWLMELDATTGQRLSATASGAPWDINGDGTINTSDLISVTINGQTVAVAPSGKESTVGGVDTPGIVSNGNLEYKYTSGSTEADLEMTTEQGSTSSTSTGGRQSWRQIR